MADPVVLDSVRSLGSTPFRIEWFGDVSYGGRSGGRSPLVNVVLARAHQGQWTRSIGGDDGPPIMASIPVAYLRLLRIGDVWVLGQRAGCDSGSIRLTFPDILIDNTTTDVRPVGLPLDETDGDPNYPLVFSEFDAHRGHTGAFCARVRLDDGIVLVVPCMELVRFYFGASGLLLNRLFSGAFATDNLYTSANCHPITGIANLTLAPGLPFPAATTVARIAFDWRAEKAAAWIAKSGVAAAANGERYYPKTTFPFVGSSDLTVDGRWLDAGLSRVFLVERLLQCTRPFPFKRLYARSATEIAGEQQPNKSKTAAKGKASKRTKNARGHNRTLLEGYVTRALLPMAIEADDDFENPFPDLIGKSIHRMVDASVRQPAQNESNKAASEFAAGATSSSIGGRGTEVMAAHGGKLAWDIEPEEVILFRAAFQELLERGETAASLLPPLSAASTGRSKSPFVRGDWIVSAPDEQSRKVWCAKISPNDPLANRHLVALIRPQGEEAARCKAVLVPISGQITLYDAEVHKICADFAADRLSLEDVANAIALDGKCEINLEGLLAFLRVACKVLVAERLLVGPG